MPPGAMTARLGIAASDIKLSHSVFALPFALLAAVVARPESEGWRESGIKVALVVVCMVLARTWAMLVNRLADAAIDRENPRTAGRAFASGRLGMGEGWAMAWGSAAGFVAVAAMFGVLFANWWPAWLAAPVLAWIALYSWMKRVTWACHLVLGTALAASPVAAAIAVDPGAVGLAGGAGLAGEVGAAMVWWLAGMVVLWVAGFDVIYALQDVEFDRSRGLFSVPASLGVPAAIWISRAMHAGAWVMLVMAWRSEPRFGVVFGVAVVLVAGLLAAEHAVLARRGKAGLEMAFFTLNGVVSVVVGVLGCVDVWLG